MGGWVGCRRLNTILAVQVAQRGASGSPRELERLRREVAELKRDNEACLVGLRLKDEVGWSRQGVDGVWVGSHCTDWWYGHLLT